MLLEFIQIDNYEQGPGEPAAEGWCVAGRRAQSSGHTCPGTEAMRTAAVPGGGQETPAQGVQTPSVPAVQVLSLHTYVSCPDPTT